MAALYCNKCGHRNPDGANFCSSCGHVLEVGAQPSRRAGGEETTLTFLPDEPPAEAPEEELPVDVSELAKAEGAVTCCSLIIP